MSFANPSNGIIIQTGHDFDLSDLANNTGVTTTVDAGWWEIELKDLDVSGNANELDIGHDGSGTHHHHDYEIVNSANGSNIMAMWRPVQRDSYAQRGVVATSKEVSLNIKDADGNVSSITKDYA